MTWLAWVSEKPVPPALTVMTMVCPGRFWKLSMMRCRSRPTEMSPLKYSGLMPWLWR